jgi:hypothetical protein
MSSFDDIADEDLRTSHVTSLVTRDSAADSERYIQDKCDELLRLAHDIPLEFQPAPHFVALLQEIWAHTEGREQLLSSGRPAAERLADVAQRVRHRAGALSLTDHSNKLLDAPNFLDDFRRCVLYLLVKLSARNNLFPFSLFLYGTQLGRDRDVVAGGRFADIYKGVLGTQEVAIKRMRVVAKSESDRCRKVIFSRLTFFVVVEFAHVVCRDVAQGGHCLASAAASSCSAIPWP